MLPLVTIKEHIGIAVHLGAMFSFADNPFQLPPFLLGKGYFILYHNVFGRKSYGFYTTLPNRLDTRDHAILCQAMAKGLNRTKGVTTNFF
jgi:hypothetical protein